ncbi:platelet endothelial aggregation receptor 1-like isoform X1 [Atheta coriaria]|uniref:platelet endothelial aggregation receptor 1-like isoform X1 n=1 Tax=Dalotia coriaria TaxID=877792 RepID=UPI0031F3EF2A
MNPQHFVLVIFTAFIFFSFTNGQTGTNTTTTNNTTTTTTANLNCSANETLAQSGQDCLTCATQTASCPLINEARCYCNSGYVRNTTNACILPAYCSAESTAGCYANSTLSSMSSNCFTCDNYRTASCPLSTSRRCYCNDGYVSDIDNQRCVYPVDCPVYAAGQCRANQTFSDRGYDCDTCANYQTNRECFVSYQARCYCNVGFVREVRTQRCIRQQDCPSDINEDCSVNQTLANYGYDCATCANPAASCSPINLTKCYCLNGYVRTVSGDCVQPQDCARAVDLPAGASCRDPWSVGCNPECVPTCRRRDFGFFGPGRFFCRPACEVCYCPTGQVRNDNGDCIPQNQCRQYPYNFPNFRFTF